MMRIAIVVSGLAVSGCATTNRLPDKVSPSTFCQIARGPITWHKDDTRGTKEQIDSFNRVGKKLCGWGTKKKA